LILSLLIWQLSAWRCLGTKVYSITIPENSYIATCGWYTFQFQTWCPSATSSFMSPASECNLEPTGSAGNMSCPVSSKYGSCLSASTCFQTVSAPATVDLCFVMVNFGNMSITCDVSESGVML